jgi:hypothetical protein
MNNKWFDLNVSGKNDPETPMTKSDSVKKSRSSLQKSSVPVNTNPQNRSNPVTPDAVTRYMYEKFGYSPDSTQQSLNQVDQVAPEPVAPSRSFVDPSPVFSTELPLDPYQRRAMEGQYAGAPVSTPVDRDLIADFMRRTYGYGSQQTQDRLDEALGYNPRAFAKARKKNNDKFARDKDFKATFKKEEEDSLLLDPISGHNIIGDMKPSKKDAQ